MTGSTVRLIHCLLQGKILAFSEYILSLRLLSFTVQLSTIILLSASVLCYNTSASKRIFFISFPCSKLFNHLVRHLVRVGLSQRSPSSILLIQGPSSPWSHLRGIAVLPLSIMANYIFCLGVNRLVLRKHLSPSDAEYFYLSLIWCCIPRLSSRQQVCLLSLVEII